jgi:hypothetical protein
MKTLPVILSTIAAAAVLSASPAAQAAAPAPECRNADLTASYRGGHDAATMHVFGRIVLTNTSSRTCTVRGFGGLSYVGHGDGSQVGAAAVRDPGTPVRTVVLAPGERAKSRVSEARVGAYDSTDCTPVRVDGFRVYVPDSRVSQFVAHRTTGCSALGVQLIGHQAYRA